MEIIKEISNRQVHNKEEVRRDDFNWGTTLVTIMIFLIYIGATFYVLMESYN